MTDPKHNRVSIRKAQLLDNRAICQLVNSAYRGDSGLEGWTTESELLAGQRINEELLAEQMRDGEILLATDGENQLIGCVHIKMVAAKTAYLGMLTTNPKMQSAGVSTQLLRAAEDYARNQFGAESVEMTVISLRRELIQWYAKRGYAPTGEKRPFPYGDERFGVPLRDDLEFSVLQTPV